MLYKMDNSLLSLMFVIIILEGHLFFISPWLLYFFKFYIESLILNQIIKNKYKYFYLFQLGYFL